MQSVPSSTSINKYSNNNERTASRGELYSTAGVSFLPTLYLEEDHFSISEVELGDTFYSLQEGLADM